MSNNPILHRLSQLVSLLLGARIFVLALFTFTLYVSTFFLFNQEENLRKFVFDYKVHGIIFCSVLSIAAGGIINRFYDNPSVVLKIKWGVFYKTKLWSSK